MNGIVDLPEHVREFKYNLFYGWGYVEDKLVGKTTQDDINITC